MKRRISRAFLAWLMPLAVMAGSCGPTAPPAQGGGIASPTSQPLASPQEIPGVKNFAQVSPALYRGAQPSKKGFAELKKRGVKTILSLRSGNGDSSDLKGLSLQYVRIPSHGSDIGDEEILQALKIIQDPANQPVFLHCRRGADRTGCAVAAYRMLVEGWSSEQAAAEMHAFKFNTAFRGISDYVRRFDAQRFKRLLDSAEAPKIRTVH